MFESMLELGVACNKEFERLRKKIVSLEVDMAAAKERIDRLENVGNPTA